MRSSSLASLVRLSLQRDRKSALLSAFGVAVGVGALIFFLGLGLGVGRVLREQVFPHDARLVEVVPPALSLGSLLGGGALDEATVARLAALPGVEATYRKMNVRIAAASRYDGDFFGSRLRMGIEVFAVGVERGLVQEDVGLGEWKDPGAGQPIPALAATRLLEIYNKSFAQARRLPQLSKGLVLGFSFPVEFGRSFISPNPGATVIPSQLQISGVSDRAPLEGVAIPLDAAVRINRTAGVDAEHFTAIVLRAKDPSHVPALVEAVKEMGLSLDDRDAKLAENAGAAVAVTTSALALLSILICVLAAVNITHALSAQLRARAREIGVMRAVGASRADIRALVLGEASVVGLFGGVVGTVGAVLLARGVDLLARRLLPPFPFQPDAFFLFPPWVLGLGVGLGLLSALVGAFVPARAAARMDPSRSLAG